MILRPLLVALLLAAGPVAMAAPPGPAVGSWATYQWASSVRQQVPVLVRQEGAGGQVSWSIAQEAAAPAPLFVTYAVVRGDAKTYTLQVVTQQRLDGPALSVTQVRVDRASGKRLSSVIRASRGPVPTPEGTLRPFRHSSVKGIDESVSVPAGQFAALRAPYQDGTVWVSDRVPALGLVKATFPAGTLELVRSGAGGAKDLLRS